MARGFEFDVTVLGGCGRVGLPLAIAFADRGLHVGIYDISEEAVEQVSQGELPFREPGAAETLRASVADGALQATIDPAVVAASRDGHRRDRHARRRAPRTPTRRRPAAPCGL